MKSAWDIMIDDETYELLEEWYGREVELTTMVQNSDRDAIERLLDHIIEECEDSPDDEYLKGFLTRAKRAKEGL